MTCLERRVVLVGTRMNVTRPRSVRKSPSELLLVAALAALLIAIPWLLRLRASPLVGHEAPDLRFLVLANGSTLTDEGLLSIRALRGRPVLLDFWATWCDPCRKEAPIVDAVARKWRDRGLVVLGVSTDAPKEADPGEFARRQGLTYPIVRDPSGRASGAYAVDALPTLVVVSRSGTVVAVRTGMTGSDELDRLIQEVL
jgi:cytochrome c biogenesis protein CcmG/thiol:disulfide interchange protein DsbE